MPSTPAEGEGSAPSVANSLPANPGPDIQSNQQASSAAASTLLMPQGYELLGEVGRGGMGVVYRARDIRLNREVALKLLRDDCPAGSSACMRFVTEAQITSQLQHPGIPAAHELGQLPDGRPFLAMKLVKGQTLHELLHKRGDPSQERGRFLAIFEQVCQAVGYAHAHRVIHRDLKPRNIMVGAFGEVQVMDWGLARLLAAPALSAAEDEGVLTETPPTVTAIETPHAAASPTRTGSVMGTLPYMAPEQAGGEIRKLDAQSDVFGLGAILCVLLTGAPPYRGKDDNAIRLKAVRGELRETLARLDGCGAEPEAVALCKRCLAFKQEDRPTDGGAVAAAVASIRQAAEERARRAELERAEALVREAEQRKRRRVWLGLAACLLAGLLTSTGLGLWADHARQQALAAKEQAQKRLEQVEKGNEILTSIFTDLDIGKVEQDKEPLQAVLAKRLVKAAEQLEGEAVGDPLAMAQLQNRLGMALLSLGQPQPATVLFEKAYATRLDLLGVEHPDTLESMNNLALGYEAAGQLCKALPLWETNLQRRKAMLGLDDPETLTSMNNLAEAYRAAGQSDQALPLHEETLRLREAKLGSGHSHTLISMNNLALSYRDAGQLSKALPLLEKTLRLRKANLGVDHPSTLNSMNNLAAAYQATGRLDKALPLYEETLGLKKAKLGVDHPNTLQSMSNLAAAYRATGQLDMALPLQEGTLRLKKAKLGLDHPETLISMNNLAATYRSAGQLDKALPLYEETLRLTKTKLGVDHPDTLPSIGNLAVAYCEDKQSAKAVPLFAEYFDCLRKRTKPNDPVFAGRLANASQKLLDCNRYKEAESYLRECLAIREKTQADAWQTFNAQSMLGGALAGQKKYAEAEPLLLKGCQGMKQQQAKIPKAGKVRLTEAATRLVELYDAWGKPAEAAKWRKELAQGKEKGTKSKD